MLTSFLSLLAGAFVLFGDLPATSNYMLNSYGFGSGGSNSTTSNYALEGTTGEISGAATTTTNYQGLPGYIQTQQSNVPKVTLTNPSQYYHKLHFVIDTQNNPTDAKYALQISTTSDFSSNIKYVKTDFTIGGTLTTNDYKTYSSWGSGGGSNIIGLSENTTYYLRAKATHLTSFNGISTESGYGPSSSAATVGEELSFCVYTNANCGAGGNSVAFGSLLAGTATNGGSNIGIDFATNGDSGGNVFVYSNGGLSSTHAGYTLPSATANLSSASSGYGAQINGTPSQSSGGPLNKASPYDGSSNTVGILNTTATPILTSAGPLVGGSGSVKLIAKTTVTTPAAPDYTDTVTLIAAANF